MTIADELVRIIGAKTALASYLTTNGIDVEDTDKIDKLVDKLPGFSDIHMVTLIGGPINDSSDNRYLNLNEDITISSSDIKFIQGNSEEKTYMLQGDNLLSLSVEPKTLPISFSTFAQMGGTTIDLTSYQTLTSLGWENPGAYRYTLSDYPVTDNISIKFQAIETYKITCNFENATSSNGNVAYRQYVGSWQTTFTPVNGCTISDIEILENGIAKPLGTYSWNIETGVLVLNTIRGDIEVNLIVTGTPLTTKNISIIHNDSAKGKCEHNILNNSATLVSTNNYTINENGLLDIEFYVADEHPTREMSISATMGGATFDLSSYLTKTSAGNTNSRQWKWTYTDIPVSEDLVFTLDTVVQYYQMAVNLTNATATDRNNFWCQPGGASRVTIIPNDGYKLDANDVVFSPTTNISAANNGDQVYVYILSMPVLSTGITITATATLISPPNIIAPNTTIDFDFATASAGSARRWLADDGYKITQVAIDGTVYAKLSDDGTITYSDEVKGRYTLVADGSYFFMASIKQWELDASEIIITTVSEASATNSYTVSDISDASYNFALTDDWYVSQNKGVHSSAALARINLSLVSTATVTITYINYAEANYDYGMFGKLDTELSTAASADDTTLLERICKSSSYNLSSEQTLTYSNVEAGEHFIDVKFIKDVNGSSNNDTLKFKVTIS